MHRRVLIISYYFPPSGGSGVQRSLKFVKYLEAYDWLPVVVTVDPKFAAYPDLDPAMMLEIPETVSCHRTRSWDPYRIYARWTGQKKNHAVTVGFLSDRPPSWQDRVARWIRANLFIPDARVGWVPYAVRKAIRLIHSEKIDAIYTTGPPHSTHLIGRALHRRFGIPWVADFRDPWTDIDFIEKLPMTSLSRAMNRRLEKSVLDEADQVITVSSLMRRDFEKKTDTPCETILNGFDEDDFKNMKLSDEKAFVLSHIGNMNADRNPQVLWDTLERFLKAGEVSDLKIRLVGNVDQEVLASLDRAGLTPIVEKIEYLPHHEAIAYAMSSAILLLPINRVPSAKGIVTGKLFEYLAVGKPILGIGPPDGEASQILQETGAGEMIDYGDLNRVQHFVDSAYESWKSGASYGVIKPEAIARFSRKYQTGLLASLFDKLVER